MTDVYDWITKNHKLRNRRDLEELQTDTKKATSANSFSWIAKGNITMKYALGTDRILDVGCGWGRELSRLEGAIGIDLCLPFLKTARTYVKNDVVLADAQHLPFRNDAFGFVVISEVIEHIVNPTLAFEEMKRALKKRGKLLVQTPNKAVTLGRFISSERCGHVHEFTRSELRNLLVALGFAILVQTGSTIPYIPSTNRFEKLNSNRLFFSLWKILNRFIPLKWDIIFLSELANERI
jgi:ubiquinone/menaquinone biosynthesis C-methylase UbiE